MSRGLSTLGHQVTVICGFGQQARESLENNVRVLRVIDTTTHSRTPAGVQICSALETLRESESVDVIEFSEHEGLGLEFQQANCEVPVVVKLHGDTELCAYGVAPGWKRLAYYLHTRDCVTQRILRERESVRLAHAIVSPSRWLLEEDIRRGWPVTKRSFVVPNPFSGGLVGTQPKVEQCPPRVLWLARLDRRKGADLLPGIAREVWSKAPETEFHIIGQQEPRPKQGWIEWILDRVPEQHRNSIKYLGGLPYDQIARTISAYPVAIFASTWENFPYTELECMWSGLACVSASGGGACELGVDGESHVRALRKPSAIARAVVELFRDRSRIERIGKSGQAHVQARFSAQALAAQMVNIYTYARDRTVSLAEISA